MAKSARSKPFEYDEQLQALQAFQVLYDKLSPEDQRLVDAYGLFVVSNFTKRIVDVMVGYKNG